MISSVANIVSAVLHPLFSPVIEAIPRHHITLSYYQILAFHYTSVTDKDPFFFFFRRELWIEDKVHLKGVDSPNLWMK